MHSRGRITFAVAASLSAIFAATLGVGAAVAAQTDPPIAYTLDEFRALFLTNEDVRAAFPGTLLVPDAGNLGICAVTPTGRYTCTLDWPINTYNTFARPYNLRVDTYATPALAAEAVSGLHTASGRTSLYDSPTDWTLTGPLDATHDVVTSYRLDRNHLIQATCVASLSLNRETVSNINTCTQRLINAQAPRLASLESPVVAPPGAPLSVLTSIANGSARVTWLAPESDGGSAIASYTAVSTDGSLRCTVAPTTAVLQTCAAPGARAGVDYSFTVTAANAKGPGPASQPSQSGRFTTAASAPREVTAKASGTSVTVRWRAPEAFGGLPVTRYVVSASPGGKQCTTRERRCTIQGLAYSTNYRFTVRAINGKGPGPIGTSKVVKTGAAPPPPPVATPQPDPAPAPTPTSTKAPEQPR